MRLFSWESDIFMTQVLKIHTREVLYEKYRTEKLLARRATRNISDEDRLKLLEGTYVPLSPFELSY